MRKEFWKDRVVRVLKDHRKVVGCMGVLVIMSMVSAFSQDPVVDIDLENNPAVIGALGIAKLLTKGFGGFAMILGIFIWAWSMITGATSGRGLAWKALAGGAALLVAEPTVRWCYNFWKNNTDANLDEPLLGALELVSSTMSLIA